MGHIRNGALLAGIVGLALGGVASAQTLTDAEFKCQGKVSKAGSKFVGSKAKCGSKCIQGARKVPPVNPISDCYAPYGGATLACIADPLKGAEAKFALAIKKSCDPATVASADCPECYSGGDCSDAGEAGDRVQNVEGQVDSFGPGVFCEQTGADALETTCELNTAKVLAKHVGSINKCYDKCNSNMRKALIAPGSCTAPSPSDATTTTCLNTASGKSILGVDKKCRAVGQSAPGANDGTTAVPDCSATNDYPSGAAWTNLVNLAINGNVPGTYCAD